MKTVEAPTLFQPVPPGLPSLVFSSRPAHGPTTRVLAVGDIGFSGRVGATGSRLGYDYLFEEVSPFLSTGDIVFGNLEYPLGGGGANGRMFEGDPQAASSLRKGGFTLMHLANNHVGEYGLAGLSATLEAVRTAGLAPLGAGIRMEDARGLVRTDANGLRIGWLGCGRTLLPQSGPGPWYWEFSESELLPAVRGARPGVDVLIVSIHIGLMFIDYPRPEHKTMAERLMDAGADLVLMHHAHVLQGVQVTPRGSVCCYNLGNFVLDWREGNVEMPVMVREQQQGAVFVFDLDHQGVALAAALPIHMDEDYRVHWAVNDQGRQILDRLQRISQELEGDFITAFKRQRAERNTAGILRVLWFHLRRGHLLYVLGGVSRARPEHLAMGFSWLSGAMRHRLRKPSA